MFRRPGLWSNLTVQIAIAGALAGTAAGQPKFEYKGVTACTDCHHQPNPRRSQDLVLLTESHVWESEDKHSNAYQLLFSARGKQLVSKLDIADVSQAQQCLSCHSGWQRGHDRPRTYAEGVTCESCHGPASGWQEPHHDRFLEWRTLDPETKLKEYGMIDVRNPLVRAQQCFSCHIGNAAEGKVVTHRMYAAGHPPLPSIELATFSLQMPPHWRELSEKGNFRNKDAFVAANYGGVSPAAATSDYTRTKAVMLGGVIALRESITLFASQYQEVPVEATQSDDPHVTAWPQRGEFALFDCAACHHELRSPSWRLQRGYAGLAPGRPRMPAWPAALVKVSLRHLAGDDDQAYQRWQSGFDDSYKQLQAAVARQPFGDPEATQQAAMKLRDLLTKIAQATAASPCNADSATQALDTLSRLPANAYLDYRSARQIAWAIATIQTELTAGYPDRSLFPAAPQDGESNADRQAREAKDVAVFKSWRAEHWQLAAQQTEAMMADVDLMDSLQLRLPAGRDAIPAESDEPFVSKIDRALPQILDAAANYDPIRFRSQLTKLRARLGFE